MEEEKKQTLKLVFVLIVLLIITGLVIWFVYFRDNNSKKNNSVEEDVIEITSEPKTLEIDYSEEEQKESYEEFNARINLLDLSIAGSGAYEERNVIKINKEGTYYFYGEHENANIIIEAKENAVVKLVFDNVKLTSINTAVINCVSAKEVIINIPEGTRTVFDDGNSYSEFTGDNEPNSLIFSKADLTINGKGSLRLTGNYKDALYCASLKIINTTVSVNAKEDGIKANSKVMLKDSKLTVSCDGDGIKTINEGDLLDFIYIDSGSVKVTSKGDAIKAKNILRIDNGPDITISTNGNVEDKTNKESIEDFRGYARDKDGNEVPKDTLKVSEQTSSKGISAGKEITISGGNINIESANDAIYSNGYIIINSINTNISTGSTGIHADNNIIVKEGTININKSYDGIEAQNIQIDNGEFSIIAKDNGFNINGGLNRKKTSIMLNPDRALIINGGIISINSQGDGLDSNGSIKVTGGIIVISGPTNSKNGAIDYADTFEMSGGKAIYFGAVGMWLDANENSSINTLSYIVSANNGDTIVIKDEAGNEVESITINKPMQRISFASENIKEGSKYTLFVNDEAKTEVTATKGVTSDLNNQPINTDWN